MAAQHLLRQIRPPVVRHGHPLPHCSVLGDWTVSAAASRRDGSMGPLACAPGRLIVRAAAAVHPAAHAPSDANWRRRLRVSSDGLLLAAAGGSRLSRYCVAWERACWEGAADTVVCMGEEGGCEFERVCAAAIRPCRRLLEWDAGSIALQRGCIAPQRSYGDGSPPHVGRCRRHAEPRLAAGGVWRSCVGRGIQRSAQVPRAA